MPQEFIKRFMLIGLAFGMFAGAFNWVHAQANVWEIDIPYQKYVLDNGLTLIVHEDHKAPIVAVNVWYHVGSKNEKPGKTGFAHLFEHLMFNGSENKNEDYFLTMERIGATDLNGTTSEDRTNYFENVPTSALDIALWMESDRMGHLLGAIDQPKLDEQRGVVQNEKRQYENEPYAVSDELITESVFPKGHPYSWTVIGSMADLDDASLDDVHTWFKTYYGAANAVVTVAGDITPEKALEKVKQYFGDVPPGPPIARHQTWIAKRTGTHRQQVQDRVPQARLYRVWNVPEWGSADADYLSLLCDVLASGKTSRLYKRLVYDDQIATAVRVFIDAREIAGLFQIVADAKPGTSLEKIEQAIQEELDKLLAEGPTETELQRVKNGFIAGFVRGSERIGGFGGKSDILAQNMVFGGSPDFYKTTLKRTQTATAADLQAAAKRWLSDGDYVLEVTPFPELAAAASLIDRTKLPEAGAPPDAVFPKIQRAKLANGLNVVLAERHSIPVVNMTLQIDAGYAADQDALPGTARLAGDMLDEGTKSRTALEISEELNLLGANLMTGSNLDLTSVTLSALKMNLDKTLEIYADIILNPSFPDNDFQRLKKQTLAQIQREKVTPIQMALRVFPGILYGEKHAYGLPLTGSGSEASVTKITRADLEKFHQTWFKPNNATLVIAILGGDFTSRLNMNIREDKHWSYGAGSFLWSARGQRPFIAYTSVQQDKTKETIQEFEKEMKEISSTRPPSDGEFEKTRNNTILALPGSWETINDVRGSLSDLVRYGLPDDYYQTYAAKIRKMQTPAVEKAAKDILHPDKLVWVVVGDRSQIEAPLKSMGFKTIRFVDADGKIVE